MDIKAILAGMWVSLPPSPPPRGGYGPRGPLENGHRAGVENGVSKTVGRTRFSVKIKKGIVNIHLEKVWEEKKRILSSALGTPTPLVVSGEVVGCRLSTRAVGSLIGEGAGAGAGSSVPLLFHYTVLKQKSKEMAVSSGFSELLFPLATPYRAVSKTLLFRHSLKSHHSPMNEY